MDIIKAFVQGGVDHQVNILWKDEMPYFRATEIGKILGLKNVRVSIKDYLPKHRVTHNFETGGGAQDVTFLTEHGVYRLLMLSRKPIAATFQDWVEDVIVSIRKTGKFELDLSSSDVQAAIKVEADKYIISNMQAIHDALVSAYRNKYVVYFGIIRQLDNKYLLKIGSTKDIFTRANDLAKDFGSMHFFHIIECETNEKFERFLQRHKKIAPFLYTDIIHENKRSNEVFLVTQAEKTMIIDIAKRNKHTFANQVSNATLLEVETVKLKQLDRELELRKEEWKIENPEIPFVDPSYLADAGLVVNHRNHTAVRGSKIQIYNEDGSLVHTFESLIDPTRNSEYFQDCSKNMILTAIKENKIYKKYRWMKLDRDLSNNTVQSLEETVASATNQKGMVAMLHLNQTRIEAVFCDQKAAGEDRNFKAAAAVSQAIKKGTQSGGHYFKYWFDCSDELKSEYLTRAELPAKRMATNSYCIEKLNALNMNVVKVYSSMEEVIKEHKMSRKTLKNAIEIEYVVDGFKWRKLYSP